MNSNEDNVKKEKHLGRYDIMRVVFERFLADGRIDYAEKELYTKLRDAFELSDSKSSQILKEVVESIKKTESVKESAELRLSENKREYRKKLYSDILFSLYVSGSVTPEENDLISKISGVIGVEEDLEQECHAEVDKKMFALAVQLTDEKKYTEALGLIKKVPPANFDACEYFKTAFRIVSARHENLKSPAGAAASEFEEKFSSFSASNKYAFWYGLFHSRLLPDSDFIARESALLKALESAPGGREKFAALFDLAMLYHMSSKFEEALKRYDEAGKISSGDPDVAVNMVSCLLSLKKYEDAETLSREMAAKFPRNHMLLNNMGIALSKLNKNDESAQCFEKAISAMPDFYDARLNLAELYISMGVRESALKEIGELEKRFPGDPAISRLNSRVRKPK